MRSFRFGDRYRISELCVLVNFGDLCKMRLLKNIEKLSPSYDKCNLIQIMVRYKHQELIGGWRKGREGVSRSQQKSFTNHHQPRRGPKDRN